MIGKVLQAEKEEPRNVHDRYAVMLIKEDIGTVARACSQGRFLGLPTGLFTTGQGTGLGESLSPGLK